MKTTQINIRLTEEELISFKKRAEKMNSSVTDMVINLVLEKIPVQQKNLFFDIIKIDDFNYSKIGNNINQIAKFVNTSGEISKEQGVELLRLMRVLLEKKNENDEIFRKILKYLSEW